MPSRRKLKTQKTRLGWLADDNTSTHRPPEAVTNAGREVIERIQKCFARAQHPEANEAEARAAFKMASKIMEQHQIQQSDLMEAEDQSQREKRGGMSTVNIWPAEEGRKAFHQGWVDWLLGAIKKFFDCKHYSTGYEKEIEITFYGIAEHTVSAAIAFEATHNQIQDWAEQYKGVSTRNSYCLGVADGLLDLAEQEKKETEEKARQYEAKALAARIREEDIRQQAELQRLNDPSPESTSQSEVEDMMDIDEPKEEAEDDVLDNAHGEGDGNDASDNEILPDFNEQRSTAASAVSTSADFETELQKFVVPGPEPRSSIKSEPSHTQFDRNRLSVLPSFEEDGEVTSVEETAEWKSMRQLSAYREMSRDIEASVLEANKIKLKKGKRKRRSVKDRDAFKKGQKDSKKIEIGTARIEQGEEDSSLEDEDVG